MELDLVFVEHPICLKIEFESEGEHQRRWRLKREHYLFVEFPMRLKPGLAGVSYDCVPGLEQSVAWKEAPEMEEEQQLMGHLVGVANEVELELC